MAEAAGLAASILTIAGAGVSITTTLYRFTNSYHNADRKIEGIVTTVSVTASILTELGNAIKQHPDDLQKLNRWALFSDTIAGCKKDFEIIEVAIGAARKDGATLHDQQKAPKDDKTRANPWQKLKWAIGGDKVVEDLLSSLERSKSNLQLLLEASNYDTLRKLEKSHALNPQLVEQLTEIRAILPWLVTSISKLGYSPGQADGPNNQLGIPQQRSSGVEEAHPDFDFSEPPSQEIKDTQKGPHPRDNGLSSNPGDGKDVPQPPNVHESLPPQAVSREPSHERANPTTSRTLSPVVSLTSFQPPAAVLNQFDSAKYEVWLLTYRKAHLGGETKYRETVLITRPFKLAITWGHVNPVSYHFSKFQLPESQLESAILDKEATPVIELIASLPLATQKAVEDLLERRSAGRPSLARVDIVKQSAWARMIGRLKSLIVFLEIQPDEILLPRHTDDLSEVPSWPYVPELAMGGLHGDLSLSFEGLSGEFNGPIAQHRNSGEWRYSTLPSKIENPFQSPNLSRSSSKSSEASGKQSLPSEQEAERIMEEFLSKLTTSQDNKDLTHRDDATAAATVPGDGNQAEQKVRWGEGT